LERRVFLPLRQNERFFPETYLQLDKLRHTAGPFFRQGDDLTLRLYDLRADDERLCEDRVLEPPETTPGIIPFNLPNISPNIL